MTRVSHLQLKPDGGTQNTGVIRCLLPEVVYTCSPREPARTSLDSLLFWVLSGILQRSQLGPQRHKLHLSQIMNITHKRNSHSALKTHVSEIVLKNLISVLAAGEKCKLELSRKAACYTSAHSYQSWREKKSKPEFKTYQPGGTMHKGQSGLCSSTDPGV